MRPGECLDGAYQIETRARSGGMGAVYRALNLQTGRRCALKILHESGDAERFRREATVLAESNEMGNGAPSVGKFTKEGAQALLGYNFDRAAMASQGLKYERLDQLTMDILLGVR